MGGRLKQKQYQYSKEGKFLREFESLSEVVGYYNLKKGLFYQNEDKVKRMDDNTWICQNRIGREAIVKLEKIYNCPYCTSDWSTQKPIEIYNLLGKKLAEFNSFATFEKMTGIPRTTALCRANSGNKTLPKTKENTLVIKYKKQVNN